MIPKPLAGLAAFSAVLFAAAAALAQSPTPSPVGPAVAPTGPRPRIEVRPAPRLLYRRCIDWYELQYRPSGTVLYPGQHCWWVRG